MNQGFDCNPTLVPATPGCEISGLGDDFPEDDGDVMVEDPDETPADRGRTSHVPPLGIETVDGKRPHPLVRRLSEFLFRIILESKSRKYHGDDAVENQPVEALLEASVQATVRLAKALALADRDPIGSEAAEIVRGLKRARWSLAQALENAGLAKHLGSADSEWLAGLEGEFRELRNEIRRLILDYEDQAKSAGEVKPVEAESGKEGPED